MRDLFLAYKGHSFGEDVYKVNRGDTIVNIGAYCLMPNHFHFLLREKIHGGISIFMKKLLTAYSKYFNEKNTRTGTLFEGRFKAEHANNDQYLKYLFAYIHLNPVKLIDGDWKEKGIKDLSGAKKFLAEYIYSSYPDYTGSDRLQRKIIQQTCFPEYFSSEKEFLSFLDEWLKFEI